MKYFASLFIGILFIFHSCVQPPEIQIGQTYFTDYHIQLAHVNALTAIVSHEVMDFSGVYWDYLYGTKKYPALLRLDSQNQLSFLLLSDSLAVHPGDFIRVSGVPFDSLLFLTRSYTQNTPVLRVDKFKMEHDTHLVLQKAHHDYQTLKDKLQQEARLTGSKLIWPVEPEWQLFIDEKRSMAIVYFSAADLMYAMDVNLVYEMSNYALKTVYAREWFKGE